MSSYLKLEKDNEITIQDYKMRRNRKTANKMFDSRAELESEIEKYYNNNSQNDLLEEGGTYYYALKTFSNHGTKERNEWRNPDANRSLSKQSANCVTNPRIRANKSQITDNRNSSKSRRYEMSKNTINKNSVQTLLSEQTPKPFSKNKHRKFIESEVEAQKRINSTTCGFYKKTPANNRNQMVQSIYSAKKQKPQSALPSKLVPIGQSNQKVLNDSTFQIKRDAFYKKEDQVNMYRVLKQYKELNKYNVNLELFFDQYNAEDLRIIVENVNREIIRLQNNVKTIDNVIDVNDKGSTSQIDQDAEVQNKKYALLKMSYQQNRSRDPNAPSMTLLEKIRTSLDSDASTFCGMNTRQTCESQSIERFETEINQKINYAVKNSSNDLKLKRKAIENTVKSQENFVKNVREYLNEQNNVIIEKEMPKQFDCTFKKVTNHNRTLINKMYSNKEELDRRAAQKKAKQQPEVFDTGDSYMELTEKKDVLIKVTDNIEFIKSYKFLENDTEHDNVVNRFKDDFFFGMTNDPIEPIVDKIEPDPEPVTKSKALYDNLDWDDAPVELTANMIRKYERKQLIDEDVRKGLLSSKTDINKTFDDLDRRYKANQHWANLSHHYRHSSKKEWEEQDYGEIVDKVDWHKNNKKYAKPEPYKNFSPNYVNKSFVQRTDENKKRYNLQSARPVNQNNNMVDNLKKSFLNKKNYTENYIEGSKYDEDELSGTLHLNDTDNNKKSHRTRERLFRVKNIQNSNHTKSFDDMNPHENLQGKLRPHKYDRKGVFTNDIKTTIFTDEVAPKDQQNFYSNAQILINGPDVTRHVNQTNNPFDTRIAESNFNFESKHR